MADLKKELVALANLADQVVATDVQDVEAFAEVVERYLQAVERWRTAVEFGGGRESLDQAAVEALQSKHQKVIDLVGRVKTGVLNEISGVQRRAQVLKAYVDNIPSRVSITGKREG